MAKYNRPDHLMPMFAPQRIPPKPYRMSKIDMSEEERILLETQALDIFTVCSNAGLPLRSTLLAILVTGIDWGVNALKESKSKEDND